MRHALSALKTLALLAALLAPGGGPAFGADPAPPPEALAADQAASDFVRQLPWIRVGLTPAPGNGHQAYAIAAMRRLRELGFTGKFEVFYDPELKPRLEFLFPGFRPSGPQRQELDGGRIALVPWHKDQLEPYGPYHYVPGRTDEGKRLAPLAILGGDDNSVKPEELNAEGLIRIQPTGWKHEGTAAVAGQDAAKGLRLLEARDLPTRVAPASADAALLGLLDSSPKLRAKRPGLEALLAGRQQVEVLAAYGLSYRNGPRKLANLLIAVNRAKGLRPVVVPLLSSFNAREWETFRVELRKDPATLAAVEVVEASAATAGDSLRALRPGRILVMPVGGVPPEMWNALVDRSTLPPTVAGTMSVNHALSRGRPYLTTAPSDAPVPRLGQPLHRKVNEALSVLDTPVDDEYPNEERLKPLIHFIESSMDRGSELSRAYEALGREHALAPDKVSVTLMEAEKHFSSCLLDKLGGLP